MPTTRTPTGTEGRPSSFAPQAVPVRELYGALMETWRTRDIAEAQFNLERLSSALEAQGGRDEGVATTVRTLEMLLHRHADGASVDDDVASALVALKRGIEPYF